MGKYFISDVNSETLREFCDCVPTTRMGNTIYVVNDNKMKEFEKASDSLRVPVIPLTMHAALDML
jgi:hypothetical protein